MHRDEKYNHYHLGMSCYAKRDHNKAIACFTAAITSNECVAESYLQRAKSYYYLYKNQLSISDSQQALRLGDASIQREAHLMLGRVYLDMKKYDVALVNSTRAIQMLERSNVVPNNVYYFNRAVIYSCLQRTEAAIFDFEKSLISNPLDPECFAHLGEQYYKIGDKFNAFRCFIEKLLLEFKQEGCVSNKLIENNIKYLASYNAEDVLDKLKRFGLNNVMAEIQKCCPPETADADFYLRLARAMSTNLFFTDTTINMYFKAILIGLKAGNNSTKIIREAFNSLIQYNSAEIESAIEALKHEDVEHLLAQCQNQQTVLGERYITESENTLMHWMNFKKYMQQHESIRLSVRGLDVLFSPQETESSSAVAKDVSSASKNLTL